MSGELSSPTGTRVASPKWKDYIYKPGTRTCWRGIYHWEDEEDEEWKEALKDFPYQVRRRFHLAKVTTSYLGVVMSQVPSFETEEETMAFMTKWCRVGSNRDERNYMHIFTLLTSWEQVRRSPLVMEWHQVDRSALKVRLCCTDREEAAVEDRLV